MNRDDFLAARSRYWRSIVAKYEPGMQVLPDTEVPSPTTRFVVAENGLGNWLAVFEDEGDTGYLYLYDYCEKLIARHVHVYDRSPKINVRRGDVKVLWDKTKEKCGVVIWSKMRAVMDLKKDKPYRAWMADRYTEGVDDPKWLEGFDFTPRVN